ncbi:MAG: hypothetical protein WD231_02725 [Candidatus Woykebacteria bacterium]
MDIKDPVLEKLELVIDSLRYAHENDLDINNSEDVAKILDANDPEHKENIDEFVMLLKNTEAFMEMTSREKDAKKTDLPN